MRRFLTFIVLITLTKLCISQELFNIPSGISTRWASPENWKGEKGKGGMESDGRKGSPFFVLKSGATKILAESYGATGIVRRIWMTIGKRNAKMLQGIKIEMYWDGSETPAVSVPIGNFFGQALGTMNTFENIFFSCPEGRSFNCVIPMPFRKSMRIQLLNSTDENLNVYFDVDYTLGDKVTSETPYFHAFFNHQLRTEIKKDYEILPQVTGIGRFLGASISIVPDQDKYLDTWWGEGEVKIYLDGDTDYPTLCGTGSEDYVSTGYGLGKYSQLYHGCTIADSTGYAFYRFHVPDPVYFYRDIKVTIQQIGYTEDKKSIETFARIHPLMLAAGENPGPVTLTRETKAIIFERSDEVTSCAYFYLLKTQK
jgi:hypothetical protein